MFTRLYRPCIVLLLLMLPLVAGGRQAGDTAFLIVRDSLPKALNHPWRYHGGDDTAWASERWNDSAWTFSRTEFYNTLRDTGFTFPGIGWFRTRIRIDSTLVGRPLAVVLRHTGASEVYVDGRRVARFGSIAADPLETVGDLPQGEPALFVLSRPGEHVLAVRYADTDADRNLRRFGDPAGFSLSLAEPANAIHQFRNNGVSLTFISVFFFSFFFAFALLHLILFLYYRAARSNLWFAILNISLGMAFLTLFLANVSREASLHLWMRHHTFVVVAMATASMSAFVNELFGIRRFRFKLAALMVFAGALCFVFRSLQVPVMLILIALASLESIVLILRAIFRKVPGARIIGAGILLFLLLVITIFVLGVLTPRASFALEGDWGLVVGMVIFITIISIPLSMSVYLAWYFARVRKHLSRQLAEVGRLSEKARRQEAEKQRMLEHRGEELEREVAARTEELSTQKKKSDDLLLNILPAEIADELKEKGSSEARLYNDVSVLFTDFVDFTQMGERLSPAQLVTELDCCFKAFDEIITRHGLEKIKTVGDAYIAVSGLPAANEHHARDVVRAAMEIRSFMQERRRLAQSFSIRLGVHSGPVVAGIVGIKKFAYDIWGDTVNTAARMEQHSEPDKLNISGVTYELVKDDFVCSFRGELEVKHKGKMSMYFVEAAVSEGTILPADSNV